MKDLLYHFIEFEKHFKPESSRDYNKLSSIPSVYDRMISDLLESYVNASAEERKFIRDSFSDKYSFTLFFFSERMACLAVRAKSEKYLFEGLIAHAIEGGKFDWRENILVLSLIYHSAVKLGCDPNVLFKRAAGFAEEPIAQIIQEFPDRKPEERSIQAMGYEESTDDEGFLYKRTW